MPGPRVLCIQWKHVLSYQKLEMLPGPAADLVLVDFDNREVCFYDYRFLHTATSYFCMYVCTRVFL